MLEVWDAAGNKIISPSMNLGRVLGKATIDGAVTDIVTDAAYTPTSRPFWAILPANSSAAPDIANYDTPSVSWSPLSTPPGLVYSPGYSTAGKTFTLVYGVF